MPPPSNALILADDVDLVVDLTDGALALGLEAEVRLSRDPIADAMEATRGRSMVAIALTDPPDLAALTAWARSARQNKARALAAIFGAREAPVDWVALARDLGVVAVDECDPLLAAIAIVKAEVDRPWAVSLAGLGRADRARFSRLGHFRQSGGGWITRMGPGRVGIARERTDAPTPLGSARDAESAILAFHAADGAQRAWEPLDLDRGRASSPGAVAVREAAGAAAILFGPKRALSDPASKAALRHYGVSIPAEELCTSASRAANEAQRMGFPVHIAVASPELRLWDHPDLAVANVGNAAQVREVFRELVATAEARDPRARILGVTVGALGEARALLRVRIEPVRGEAGVVLATIGFADAHGQAAGDVTHTILPLPEARLERVLARLAGAELLVGSSIRDRKHTVESLAACLNGAAALVRDHAGAVDAVEIEPLAVLVHGGAEVREAAVHVSDVFERGVETGSLRTGS